MKAKPCKSKRLLQLCAGNPDLAKQRLAERTSAKCGKVIITDSGLEVEADEWLKSNKKNLTV